jgi:hypothetical protein
MTIGDFRGRFPLMKVVVNTLFEKIDFFFNNAKVRHHKGSEA